MHLPPEPSESDLDTLIRWCGISELAPAQRAPMLARARLAMATGAAIPRQRSKSIEPAGVFRVGLPGERGQR